jgi:DnaJ-class molecular chaperone
VRLSKLHHPLAACNVCHALTNQHEALNHRCDKTVTGRRCYGTYKSGVANLWDQCDSCEATGKVGSQPCSECGGFGWRLYG